jgi:multidrug efflux pump
LLAIVLSIGLVVDDAIVMMENIYVKIEQGMTPLEAGLKGSDEIFFAIISTTITLIAVFFPIVFLEGMTGRLIPGVQYCNSGSCGHFIVCGTHIYSDVVDQAVEDKA